MTSIAANFASAYVLQKMYKEKEMMKKKEGMENDEMCNNSDTNAIDHQNTEEEDEDRKYGCFSVFEKSSNKNRKKKIHPSGVQNQNI
ncbi:hypothetical protein C5167_008346 [Papaver somniferum]|uniref:Uncharacterized protein n=1 Tax=Papaver somniferum TaxID=3469 RepID=A0A4Y7JY67_PAPSO|nr:hypothetical protein C5167_008346 [Papaver somniferum]